MPSTASAASASSDLRYGASCDPTVTSTFSSNSRPTGPRACLESPNSSSNWASWLADPSICGHWVSAASTFVTRSPRKLEPYTTPPDDLIRLLREAAEKAVRFSGGRTRQSRDDDELLRLGLTKLVEIVGEAAKQVSESVRTAPGRPGGSGYSDARPSYPPLLRHRPGHPLGHHHRGLASAAEAPNRLHANRDSADLHPRHLVRYRVIGRAFCCGVDNPRSRSVWQSAAARHRRRWSTTEPARTR